MSFVADLAPFFSLSIFLFWGGLDPPPSRHMAGHQIANCNFSGHKQQLIRCGQACRPVSLTWGQKRCGQNLRHGTVHSYLQ